MSKNNKCSCGSLLILGKYQDGTCVRDDSKIVIIFTTLCVFIVIFIPILILNLKSLKC